MEAQGHIAPTLYDDKVGKPKPILISMYPNQKKLKDIIDNIINDRKR